MLSTISLRRTLGALLALAPLAFAQSAGRAAEADAPPPAAEVKALIDENLADWEDAAARQAVLRQLHDVFPARVADLEDVIARNRDEAAEIAEDLIQQANRLVDLKEAEPLEYERVLRLCRLDDQCLGLSRKARAAQGPERDALIAELKKTLGEAFDAKQDTMQRELAAMEAETENLRRRVTRRAENRDQLIDRRALDLLGDREAEW
jgi:hypothetical protein